MSGNIQLGKTEQTTIPATVYKYGELNLYEVSSHEIDQLRGSNFWKTLSSTLFGMGLSSVISIIITIATVEIIQPIKYASFVGALIISILISFIFGIIWIRIELQSSKLAQRFTGKQNSQKD